MRRSKKSSAEQQTRGNFTPPSRAAAPAAVEASADAPQGRGASRMSPRNWRVATRLNAILLIPVALAIVMGGFQVNSSVQNWRDAQDAEKTALIVRAAAEYGHALLNERDLTAPPLLSNRSREGKDVTAARGVTDAAKTKFDAAVRDTPDSQGLRNRLNRIRQAEPQLPALRQTAYTAAVESKNPVATEEGYRDVQHFLMEVSNELSLGSGNITSYGRTVYAVELAKAAESLQRSIGLHLLIRPSGGGSGAIYDGQVKAFCSYNYLETIALGEYASGGTQYDVDRLREVMKGKADEGAKKLAAAQSAAQAAGKSFPTPPARNGSMLDGMAAEICKGQSPARLAAKGIVPATWMAAATAKFEGYAQIENELVDKAVTDAAQISEDSRNDAIINGAIVVIAVLAAFVLAGTVARQMSRSMKRLRTAAFSIAEQRLPMLVDQLSRTEPGRVDTRVQPIPITSHDEIGEVARAFDQVHREAVRLAAEQAMLRGNVNAIFTNLSRRNQSLIEGQLTLITDLENNEADPDQLESLFRLDHLATRMRRNGENLLVLAGEEPGRRWNQPVPLVDVLRAASSEVESYERIELTGVPESEIHGQAVTDLVHLLAELLENATTFSSPQTKVRVNATRLPDGRVMVEIHDKGIGLTPEDFADINHKLANPPTVDAAVSQRMGLFVVGRLADRHSIRVQLRPSGEQAGTTSLVMLPDAITHGGGGESRPQDDFTVSPIMVEQQQEPARPSFEAVAPMRTAAELGFDDSQYEASHGRAGQSARTPLDPVNRSLQRGERRAALEGRTTPGEDRPLFRDEVPQQGTYQEQGFEEQGYQEQGYGEQGYAEPRYEEARQEPAYQEGTTSYDRPDAPYDQPDSGYDQQDSSYDQNRPQYDRNGYPAAPQPSSDQPASGGFDGFGPRDSFGSTEPYQGQPQQQSAQPPQPYAEPEYQGYEEQPQQANWQDQNGFPTAYDTSYPAQTESGQSDADALGTTADPVGFDRPGSTPPAPRAGHALTDAGLPRRGSQSGPESMLSRHSKSAGGTERQEQAPQAAQPAQVPPPPQTPQAPQSAQAVPAPQSAQAVQPPQAPQPPQAKLPQRDTAGGAQAADGDWRTSNDERWQRAEKLKDPKAGGVTPSGLPKRVPKANLVEGAAEQTPQGGPQVSRAPEDVRGRLSNLRRGVQRGRNAGTDQDQTSTYDQHSGPGSTYNQER